LGLAAIEQAGERMHVRSLIVFLLAAIEGVLGPVGCFFFPPVETGGLQAFLMAKNVPNGKGFVIKLPPDPQDYQGSQLCNHMADAVYDKLVKLQAI
jgi:hypothetical protein